MSKKHRGRYQGDAVTYQLPSPAGGVQLETFVPWTLVKRGLRKQIITPLDAPQEFMEEARRGSGRPASQRRTPRCYAPSGWPITGSGCWMSNAWGRWPRSRMPRRST